RGSSEPRSREELVRVLRARRGWEVEPPRGAPRGGGGVHHYRGYRGLNPHHHSPDHECRALRYPGTGTRPDTEFANNSTLPFFSFAKNFIFPYIPSVNEEAGHETENPKSRQTEKTPWSQRAAG